jgi:hypothetical protein
MGRTDRPSIRHVLIRQVYSPVRHLWQSYIRPADAIVAGILKWFIGDYDSFIWQRVSCHLYLLWLNLALCQGLEDLSRSSPMGSAACDGVKSRNISVFCFYEWMLHYVVYNQACLTSNYFLRTRAASLWQWQALLVLLLEARRWEKKQLMFCTQSSGKFGICLGIMASMLCWRLWC